MVNTGNTTQARGIKANSTIKRLGLIALVACLASITLLLSYPRFSSSLSYIPVDAALKRHWEDYPIRQNQFPALIEIAQQAIQTLDLARYWQGLGWLYYLQVKASNVDTPAGDKLLGLSQTAFETSLKKSPANPAAWLRLAWIHALLEHDNSLIVNTLAMSFHTGRAERYLLLNRLDLALRYAEHFEEQDLALLRDQIQLAWRLFPAEVIKFIQSGAFDRDTLLKLIEHDHPELTTEIQDRLQ